MTIKRAGVVGCGLMGGGITQVVAHAGLPVTVVEANRELLDRGLGAIRRNLDGLVEKGRLEGGARDATWDRIAGSVSLDDLRDADLVIEAITENVALKKETFGKLYRICPPSTLLASNTSSCTITDAWEPSGCHSTCQVVPIPIGWLPTAKDVTVTAARRASRTTRPVPCRRRGARRTAGGATCSARVTDTRLG